MRTKKTLCDTEGDYVKKTLFIQWTPPSLFLRPASGGGKADCSAIRNNADEGKRFREQGEVALSNC